MSGPSPQPPTPGPQPLTPGVRFGPYEIVARLGAGGMGEVYRARDIRLGREVALKVLPAAVAGDPARRSRFEQEARAAAALNHPNITGLHDVGSENGVCFIVTELIAGETLEAMIERGPVPARKLLDIAVQVADGMAAAHAAQIAHRDLKPANIMVTSEGRAKILDFGLAKQAAVALAAPDETVTVHQTEPGMILGTVAYMSPEQARGKPADYRSDQFSFGLILYEMATGRKAFDKPESVQTMSAILTEEPPPIDRAIPAPLRWAIDRCLAKEPGDRYESTRDLFQELRHLRDHLSEASTTQAGAAAAPAPRRRIHWAIPAAFAGGLLTAGALAYFLAPPRFPDLGAYRYTPFSFEPGGQYFAVWSPNGKAVAYAARTNTDGPFQVFVRYLDAATPVQITNLPDGGEPIAWAPDGMRILFRSQKTPAGIWSVASVGGEPEPFMAVPAGTPIDVSPDLKSVALMRREDDSKTGIWISSPPGSPPKKYEPEPFATSIVYNQPRLRFSPDGKTILLFLNGENHLEEAWLLPYPRNASEPPRKVLPNLPSYGGTPTFAWMPDSRRVMLLLRPVPDVSPQIRIAGIHTGRHVTIANSTANLIAAAVSPDGAKAIVTEVAGNYDVISVGLDGKTPRRLIATERNEVMPAWAAQQPVMVYVTDRNGPVEIWLRSADGVSRPVVTPRDFPAGTQWFMGPALSPDGLRVAYSRIEYNGGVRLWMSNVAGGAPVQLTNEAGATEFAGSFSPDGTWFTYHAIRNGKKALMKIRVSGQATPVLVKAAVQGEVPVWSPSGEWILAGDELISPDGQKTQPVGNRLTSTYGWSLDGKLLYGLRPGGERVVLFSVDVATRTEKMVGEFGQEFTPASNLRPSIRFSMAPDGKSFVVAAGQFKTNLWMLEGFAQ